VLQDSRDYEVAATHEYNSIQYIHNSLSSKHQAQLQLKKISTISSIATTSHDTIDY